MNALRKAILVSALAVGALAIGQGASQAGPIGTSFGAASADSQVTHVRGGRGGRGGGGGFDILSTVLQAISDGGRGGRGGGGRSRGGGRHR